MLPDTAQYAIRGGSAATIARSIERGVVTGALAPGDAVPSVRGLARDLDVSPTTVASAYRDLRQRGVLVSHDRSRTVVGHRPPLARRLGPTVPAGTTDLASGNPDPALLPDLRTVVAEVAATMPQVPRLYGGDPGLPALVTRAHAALDADGVPAAHLAVVAGGLDGIERVLEVHLRLGDRVAVEDPGYVGSLDLVRALGLQPVPVEVDEAGLRPDALATALRGDVQALLTVPRAQNPTGASLTAARSEQLRAVLADHPEVLVIEDDHAAAVAGTPLHPVASRERERWAVVRSVAKGLGPDLRTAVLAGDEDTVTRVLGRQRLGTGWVSHLTQTIVATAWTTAAEDGTLATAAATYRERREALRAACADHGIAASGGSGLNVWIEVPEEVPVVQGLAARGWAVQAGEPYRHATPAAIRVTVSLLPVADAARFAADLAAVLDTSLGTRRG